MEKKTERIGFLLEEEMRDRIEACRKKLEENGPEVTIAEAARFLIRRGLEEFEAGHQRGKKGVR